MNWDLEPEPPTIRVGACQLGLTLIALSLAVLCVANTIFLAEVFGFARLEAGVRESSFWRWGVGAFIPWCSVLGSLLLWGGRTTGPWRVFAGALLVMNGTDAAIWTIENAEALGLSGLPFRADWLLDLVVLAFGWCELYLTIRLACEVDHEIGTGHAWQALPSAQSQLTIGLALWVLLALTQTHWDWPPRPVPGPTVVLLRLVSAFLGTIFAFQATVVCLAVSRRCGAAIQARRRHEEGADLLKSRSETEADDLFR